MSSTFVYKNMELTTCWGVPALYDKESRNYYTPHTESTLYVIMLGRTYKNVKLVPVGSETNMGHGCGVGYTACGFELDNGEMIIIPKVFDILTNIEMNKLF